VVEQVNDLAKPYDHNVDDSDDSDEQSETSSSDDS